MRILLVNPHYPMPVDSVLLHPPLAYAYMAAELHARGHEVACLDLPMRHNAYACEVDSLLAYAPDLVGVTCVTQSYCQALEIVRFSKQVLPHVPTVMGGPHVTFTARETLMRHGDVDYVMRFDCDRGLADLVDALSGGDAQALRRVPGLAYRMRQDVQINEPPALVMDLDTYAPPRREIFDLHAYLRHDYETVVMTARGCPSHCTFCSTTRMGRRYRQHGVARVVDEFESLVRFGFSSFFIGDDTFPVDPQRTFAICDEIVRRGLRFDWTSNVRILDVRRDVLDAMVRAGAYRVFTGIETIQADSLVGLRKGTSPEQIRAGIETLKAAGLEVHAAFIIGVPGDTEADIENTLEFLKDVQPTVATFNTMEARPGTEIFNDPAKYGLTIADRYWYEHTDWMARPTCATRELSAERIRYWVERCYREFCTSGFAAASWAAPGGGQAAHLGATECATT